MANKIDDFLNILNDEHSDNILVSTTTVDNLNIKPLTFKQQKELITSGVNGLEGVMSFVKSLNEVILSNTGTDNLKIYDRIPIALALRKSLSDEKLVSGEVEVEVQEVISKFKKFDLNEEEIVDCGEYQIHLRIPTLKEENKILTSCIEDLKNNSDLGKNVSVILSYEIPKFISKVTFGSKTVVFDTLSNSERKKLIDKLPAKVTNKISDFIVKIREYDEQLLTVNDTTFTIDSSFFS